MHARKHDGAVVELQQDCTCCTHSGPHWLHMDGLWRRRNLKLMGHGQGWLLQERERLQEKRRQMRRAGIVELLEDDYESRS